MALLFLDLEFNQGRNSNYFEILQISAIKTDLFWEELYLFDELVYPKLATMVNKEVEKLTGITMKDLKRQGSPLYRVVREMRRNIFKGDITHILVWGNSDVRILKSNCKKNNIDCDFLEGIEVIDMQHLYTALYDLKNAPSLHTTTKDMKFCKEHYGLHDVYRLIEISKEIGLKNIFNNKSLLRNYYIKNSFNKSKKFLVKNRECICGEGNLNIFLESDIDKINENEYKKTYLLKCNSCSLKYEAIANSECKVKPFSWVKNISIINNKDYFDKINEIMK